MNFDYISNKIVFNALKHIKHGKINLINYDQKKYTFGYENDSLNVNVKINKTIIHRLNISFFSWINIEWIKAVAVSHGIKLAFSTGSHAQ